MVYQSNLTTSLFIFKRLTAVCVGGGGGQGGEAGRLITLARITSLFSAPAEQEGRGPGSNRWFHYSAISEQMI